MTRQITVLALGGVASRLRTGERDFDPLVAGERERDFFLGAGERDFFLAASGERERDFFTPDLLSDFPLRTGEFVGDRELDRDGILHKSVRVCMHIYVCRCDLGGPVHASEARRAGR